MMPLWQDWCGGMYQTRSSIMGADQAINVYVETREVPGSPKQVTMYGTPGLKLETTLATSPSRGWFTQDGQTWCVFGTHLYERTGTATFVSRGTIPDDGHRVFFASNGAGGNQLAIAGGGQINVLNLSTNVLTTAALPFTNPVMIVFQDGYGLVNELNTPTVWFCALENFLSWDALDFFARSTTSDNVVGLAVTRDRLVVGGSKTTTLYYDSGNADNPWVPYPGTSTQVGWLSPWASGVYNDVVYWIGMSARGDPKVVSTRSDMQVQTLSTPPIVDVLATCSTLSDTELDIYSQGGHTFIVMTLPSSAQDLKTYAFDLLEKRWAARAGWLSTSARYARWAARGITAVTNTILTGDYNSGNVYTLDLTTYQDNGGILRRERMAPYPSADNQWGFIDQVELGMQAGTGLSSGQGSAPVTELQVSRDGAQTWISAGFGALGTRGTYLARCLWRRLGRARMDRLVLRTVQTDPVPCVWGPGLWLSISGGTKQL